MNLCCTPGTHICPAFEGAFIQRYQRMPVGRENLFQRGQHRLQRYNFCLLEKRSEHDHVRYADIAEFAGDVVCF